MSTFSITLIDALHHTPTVDALRITLSTLKKCNVSVDQIYWFSDVPFPGDVEPPVQWIKVNQFTDYVHDYNNIMLSLVPHIATEDFNLVIHDDGYAVNADAWDPEFLNYDYIGAVWPWWTEESGCVGNGGFSLRSRKLYDALTSLKLSSSTDPEDHLICRTHKYQLTNEFGIKFAPPDLADKFSIELHMDSEWLGKSLGFHGKGDIQAHYVKPPTVSLIEILDTKSLYTDKHNYHSYCTQFYEKELAGLQNKPLQLVEVGITDQGNSLIMWNDYFSQCNIIGYNPHIDSHTQNNCQKYVNINLAKLNLAHRSMVDQLPQADILINNGPWDLQSQLTVVNKLLSKVKPGGLFVIESVQSMEDLEALKSAVGSRLRPHVEFVDLRHVKNIQDDLLFVVRVPEDVEVFDFQSHYDNLCNTPSDINEHLTVLDRLSKNCSHVTEFGVRWAVSSSAFIKNKVSLRSYDIVAEPAAVSLFDQAHNAGIDAKLIIANTLEIQNFEPTDLLFIDSLHNYDQVKAELSYAPLVNKYIVFHDTVTFAQVGEDGSQGIWPAVIEFLEVNPEWQILEHHINNNGLTVLHRTKPELKTLVFCTSYAATTETWDTRYRQWIDRVQQSKLVNHKILIVDDGSPVLPDWQDVAITSAESPIDGDELITIHHFQTSVGPMINNTGSSGWYRSFAHAVRYAVDRGYDRIFHIESDAWLISDHAVDFFNSSDQGWNTLWSPMHNFPESALQVINRDQFSNCLEFFSKTHSDCVDSSRVIEQLMPFTYVNKSLNGDRYGEYMYSIPSDADYACQTCQTP